MLIKGSLILSLLLSLTLAGKGKNPKEACLKPYFFQNYEDVNMQTLLYYNFETGFPIILQGPDLPYSLPPNLATDNGAYNRTWLNSTHYDGLFWYNGMGRLHMPFGAMTDIFSTPFGFFNGTQFIGYNMVPSAIASNFTLPTGPNGCTTFVTATLNFMSLYPYNITSCVGRANDPLYGVGFFGAIDYSNWIEFDFYLTNHRVYAVISRYPNGMPPASPPVVEYGSWVYMIPVGTRHLYSMDTYSIAFTRKTRTVTWLIENQVVLKLQNPGIRLDPRFQTNEWAPPEFPNFGLPFPTQLGFEMGVLVPDQTTLIQPACQGLYDQCIADQCPQNAFRTLCRYIPAQNLYTWNITLIMTMSKFAVTQACNMPVPCRCYAPLNNDSL